MPTLRRVSPSELRLHSALAIACGLALLCRAMSQGRDTAGTEDEVFRPIGDGMSRIGPLRDDVESLMPPGVRRRACSGRGSA
jgi:hypothetical protein